MAKRVYLTPHVLVIFLVFVTKCLTYRREGVCLFQSEDTVVTVGKAQ